MRDIGYTMETALADIIDNSITAHAKNIDVFVDLDPHYRVCVIDDGDGMNKAELHEGMRYASKDPRDARNRFDLGRFGLGLKIASLTQCKKLTVVSSKNGQVNAAIWDQDHIDQKNEWSLLIPDDPMSVAYADNLMASGTVVLWEKIDAENDHSQTEFNSRIDDCRSHLEMVFHRFISGEGGLKKCTIRLNNNPLEPFDPFHQYHPATITRPLEMIGKNVSFQVFTLPHHSKVTPEEWKRHGGQDGYLKNQGLYIYREKRLIIHGTWLKLTRQTELNKLSRVKIDITNEVDSEWGISLDKSSARLPSSVRMRLRTVIDQIGGFSKRVYTKRGQKLISETMRPAWNRIQNKNKISYEINSNNPIINSFLESIDRKSRKDFTKILDFIGSSLPVDTLYADMGLDPTGISPFVSDEDLQNWTLQQFDFYLGIYSNDSEMAVDMLKRNEPFRSYWDKTVDILRLERDLNV